MKPAHLPRCGRARIKTLGRELYQPSDDRAFEYSAGLVADPRFRHQVELLCAKGPRLPAELLAEVAIEYDLEDAIREKIRRYLDIPDEALDLTSARQLPPLPIHAVQGERP